MLHVQFLFRFHGADCGEPLSHQFSNSYPWIFHDFGSNPSRATPWQERDMFSAAFKNSLTERRHAVRVAAGVEQMELSEGRDAWLSMPVGWRCCELSGSLG